ETCLEISRLDSIVRFAPQTWCRVLANCPGCAPQDQPCSQAWKTTGPHAKLEKQLQSCLYNDITVVIKNRPRHGDRLSGSLQAAGMGSPEDLSPANSHLPHLLSSQQNPREKARIRSR
ncbi:mCG145579, partial [Mus musculus]